MAAVAHAQAIEYLIVGLGKTGLSCARYLAGAGIPFAVADSRRQPPGLAEFRRAHADSDCYLGEFDPKIFRAYPRLLVSPGIATREPAIQAALAQGAEVIGDVELFARTAPAPVLAVTGSNGKSTVTCLVAALLEGAGKKVLAGGNLGVPVLDLLAQDRPDFYALELSSFQLETTESLAATSAAILNISADHLDRYPDFDSYRRAKTRIYRGAETAVYNRDDPATQLGLAQARQALGFGKQPPAAQTYGLVEVKGATWLAYGAEKLIPVSELQLTGRHNWLNALAALALVQGAGVQAAAVLAALAGFQGLAHRNQTVAERDGVVWINDSKGTNVGATEAALWGQDRPVVLIAGGQGKGADFTLLRSAVAAKVRALVLIGQDADLIKQALADSVPLVLAEDMRRAVAQARGLAQPGDAVLLSPACASFDMFQDYAHRGEVFKACVSELLG